MDARPDVLTGKTILAIPIVFLFHTFVLILFLNHLFVGLRLVTRMFQMEVSFSFLEFSCHGGSMRSMVWFQNHSFTCTWCIMIPCLPDASGP